MADKDKELRDLQMSFFLRLQVPKLRSCKIASDFDFHAPTPIPCSIYGIYAVICRRQSKSVEGPLDEWCLTMRPRRSGSRTTAKLGATLEQSRKILELISASKATM